MNLLGQKITLRRILGMIAGVVVIGIGIAVFKFSRLGNDSISALNLRLAELVGLPFSIENVLMNLCLFVPQPPERCLSRKAGIMRCCLRILYSTIP